MTVPTVDALLPLSFLEAVRAVDKPVDHLETEVVPELQNKRLGLSETVYAQIRRYADARRRRQRTPAEEVVALARLIGRRPDAEEVFRAAGRYLAAEAYDGIPAATRALVRALPSLISRPIALGHVRRVAARYFDGTVRRLGSSLILTVPAAITADAAPQPAATAFYEAGLRELLVRLTGQDATVQLVRFALRTEGSCEWRAEWRPVG
jgi:hypothetical protein